MQAFNRFHATSSLVNKEIEPVMIEPSRPWQTTGSIISTRVCLDPNLGLFRPELASIAAKEGVFDTGLPRNARLNALLRSSNSDGLRLDPQRR